MEPSLVRLGRELGRAQDERLRGSFDHERGRARLLRGIEAKPRRWIPPVLAAATAALAVALGALWPRAEAQVEFHVTGDPGRVELGRTLRAPAHGPLGITSSDGTRLELVAGSEASIVRTDARGATVRVEQGTLRAAVVHGTNTRWRVEAGPFVVEVIGTRFEAEWQREGERFSLTLSEGAVSVSGPVLGSKRTIRAGETLSVSRRDGKLSLVRGSKLEGSPAPGTSHAAPPTGAAVGHALAAGSASAPMRVPSSSAPVPSEPLDFRALARANAYEKALWAAERAGFDALCKTASAEDLLVLGDAARLAESPQRAEQAYRAVRERFGGSNGAHAGFLLGRLAFDGRGAYAEAARYFALSLLEEPNGPFSRDAAGRLMEALDRSGDVTGAKAAAERYLEHYPEGPHSSLARTLLARP